MPSRGAANHRIADDDPRQRVAVRLRLGRVDVIDRHIHAETVHVRVDRDIIERAKAVGIIVTALQC
jgi:hypothetical protein